MAPVRTVNPKLIIKPEPKHFDPHLVSALTLVLIIAYVLIYL